MNTVQRGVLPIPHVQPIGLTAYDAKDPKVAYPPIVPLRPPAGAPNVLVILVDDCGFGAPSTFGGPCATPTAERLAASGLKFNRFHTTALCSPTRPALLTGRNHHTVGMGADHRARDLVTRQQLVATRLRRAVGRDAEAQRLFSTAQFGKCHEVPVWETSPMGPFRQWPTGVGVRVLLRIHRRRDEPVLPGASTKARRPIEPPKTPEEGYHFTEDMTDQGDRVGSPAEVADARQAVLHVLRPGRDPRAAPGAARVVSQVQGPVRRRLGCAARGDVRPPEGARCDSRRRRAHRPPRRDPRLG